MVRDFLRSLLSRAENGSKEEGLSPPDVQPRTNYEENSRRSALPDPRNIVRYHRALTRHQQPHRNPFRFVVPRPMQNVNHANPTSETERRSCSLSRSAHRHKRPRKRITLTISLAQPLLRRDGIRRNQSRENSGVHFLLNGPEFLRLRLHWWFGHHHVLRSRGSS